MGGGGGGLHFRPTRRQEKKIKGVCVCVFVWCKGWGVWRGGILLIERECLGLRRSSKDILDKVGKESIRGAVNCLASRLY